MESTPRPGACAPWAQASEVENSPWVTAAAAQLTQAGGLADEQLEAICAEAVASASEILYELSGRIFPGNCGPVTVRPVSRPTDADTRAWGSRYSAVGFVASQGFASAYGSYNPGVLAHYGSSEPPTIELPYPVTEVTQVKIDGAVIPPAEYELRDFTSLVRIRPTASAVPTARWGWPTSQIMDLPDTEKGTFSVTYMFGNAPPSSGKLAARKLAEYLVLPQLGDNTKYPTRVRTVARQGVSTVVTDVMDLLKAGMLGIYECDAFLMAHNPKKLSRQAAVWSPTWGAPAAGRPHAQPEESTMFDRLRRAGATAKEIDHIREHGLPGPLANIEAIADGDIHEALKELRKIGHSRVEPVEPETAEPAEANSDEKAESKAEDTKGK